MKNLFRVPFAMLIASTILVSCSKEEANKESEINQNTIESVENENVIFSTENQDFVMNSIGVISDLYNVEITEEDLIVNEPYFEEGFTEMQIVVFVKNNVKYGVSFDVESSELISASSNFQLNEEEVVFTIKTDDVDYENQTSSVPLSNCNSGESCAGCHYRIMMDIIESDGDSRYLCDKLGDRCNDAVMAAAIVHCVISH